MDLGLVVRACIPAAAVGLTTFHYGEPAALSNQHSTFPPPELFRVVWPVLLVLLGVAWACEAQRSDHKCLVDLSVTLLVILLCLWIFLYVKRRDKKNSVYAILGSAVMALIAFKASSAYGGACVAPLVVWLSFASCLQLTTQEGCPAPHLWAPPGSDGATLNPKQPS